MIYVPRNLVISFTILLVSIFAMGIYVLSLKHKVESISPSPDFQPLAPPERGKMEAASLYVAYDDDGVIRREDVYIALPEETEDRARAVIRALLKRYQDKPSPHPLSAGSDIKDVYIVNRNLAVLDFNADFARGHRSGVLLESLTVATIIETLSANVPQITKVKILVDGKEQATLAGHADLIATYNTPDVHELVKTISY